MPSSPKPSKRPARTAVTDANLKGAKIKSGTTFYIGDSTMGTVSEGGNGTLRKSFTSTRGNTGSSPANVYTPAKSLKDSKNKENPGVAAMGSYARNYFKKNGR